jgi:hypothetical protein
MATGRKGSIALLYKLDGSALKSSFGSIVIEKQRRIDEPPQLGVGHRNFDRQLRQSLCAPIVCT